MAIRWWENLDGPILGRYRIERLLGEGGMARVFLATDLRAERPVAFKTPKIEAFPPESVHELLSRFNREFRAQASDPIQGVIPIYESGEFTDAGGIARPYLAMQYLSGGSLGDLLGGTIGQRERTQTLAEVLDWLVPIARTLDRLHARRYLHRDVKPDNILFNSDGDPFLADLGIVGTLDPALNGSMLGSTSMGVLGSPGSPGYQSPESIQADPVLRNISASDQFSLAVTVYEALAGKLPANASTNQQWYGALINWAPIPLSAPCPDLPAAAARAVMKAMSAQSHERFASCSEFSRTLASAAQVEAVRPPPISPPPPFVPPPEVASKPLARATVTPPPPTSAGAAPVAPKRKFPLVPVLLGALVVLGLLAWARSGLREYFVEPDSRGTVARDGEDSRPGLRNAPAEPGHTGSVALPNGSVAASAMPPWVVDFDADKIDTGAEGQAVLDIVVAFLRRNPEARLRLIGHADPTEGSFEYAMGLSDRRAQGVREYLARNGIDSKRLATEARGRTSPVARSVAADGSTQHLAVRQNRRVELQLDDSASHQDTTTAGDGAKAPADPAAGPLPEDKPVVEAKVPASDRKVCQDDFSNGGVEMSISACNRIIGLRGVGDADKAFALVYRGRNNAINEDFQAAEKDLNLALKLAPTDALRAMAFEVRGKTRNVAGRIAEGASDLAQARRLAGSTETAIKSNWTTCISNATGPDGVTFVYSLSALMDVRDSSSYLDDLKHDRPDRASMESAGVAKAKADKFFGGCTPPRPTVSEAREELTKSLRKMVQDINGRFAKIKEAGGGWRIRGTRTDATVKVGSITDIGFEPFSNTARWTVCDSRAVAPDGALVRSVSIPMDVRDVPDYWQRVQSERPDRPALDAAGVSRIQTENGVKVEKFFGGCSTPTATLKEALAKHSEDSRKKMEEWRAKFPNVRDIPGGWRIRGARTE